MSSVTFVSSLQEVEAVLVPKTSVVIPKESKENQCCTSQTKKSPTCISTINYKGYKNCHTKTVCSDFITLKRLPTVCPTKWLQVPTVCPTKWLQVLCYSEGLSVLCCTFYHIKIVANSVSH